MQIDSSKAANWARVADHGQKVGWQGRDLPPGQAKKLPAAAEPIPTPPAPTVPVTPAPEATVPVTTVPEATVPVTTVPGSTVPVIPLDPQVDVLA